MKNKLKLNGDDNESNEPLIYNQYILSQIDNYKEKINKNLEYIINKYEELIIEYIKLISEKINIIKNNYFKFIFFRGYDTITTVFKIMLFYTKNVDLTYYHSQKAFYFYVEFIEQISTDQNSFLQLSSREASLFVYKKTIYDINLEVKKKIKSCDEDENNLINNLNKIIQIYKTIYEFSIQQTDKIEEICQLIKKYIAIKFIIELNKIQFEYFQLIIDKLIEFKISINVFFEILELFIKKINVKKNNYNKIKLKILDPDLNNYIENSKIFIDWIFY